MLNQLLQQPKDAYERLHPDKAVRWEHAPKDGDLTMVSFREAQGYVLVTADELAEDGKLTESAQKAGPVRRGDLVLMAAPKEVHEAVLAQDAEAADTDFRTPEITYKEHMEKQRYKIATGETRPGKGFGQIRRSYEEGTPEEFVEVQSSRSTAKEGGDQG